MQNHQPPWRAGTEQTNETASQRTSSWSSTVKLNKTGDNFDLCRERIYRNTHPRRNLTDLRWKGTVASICLASFICGYDVSNVVNIQARIYEALEGIELLAWISLSYSLAVFSVLSYARKVVQHLDLRWVYLFHLVVFMVGAVVSGSGKTLKAVIVGRSIMGMGGAVILQTNTTYLTVLATPDEIPTLVAYTSVSWATGLAVGGPIGSSFSDWRWAFYLNLPLVAMVILISLPCIPHYTFYSRKTPISQKLREVDPVGITLNALVPELFAIAVTFANPVWEWKSAPSIVTWAICGLGLITWIAQQYFCWLTTKEGRCLPLHILPRLELLPIWIASACAGAIYAVTLTYTPLFFAFVRGSSALEQSVKLLPFTLTFIFTLLLTGRLLPKIKAYKLLYITGGTVILVCSVAVMILMQHRAADAVVLSLEGLIGFGLGLQFQHGISISNAMFPKQQSIRLDSLILCNMTLFGGIAATLAIAGSVFQNTGYNLMVDTIGSGGFAAVEIREALAGMSSRIWQDPIWMDRALGVICNVISREFWLSIVAGLISFLAGLVMTTERLAFSK